MTLRSETCGTRLSAYGLLTASPSGEAMVTRKRGFGRVPLSLFHNRPALWNTSIGPIAVEA